MKKTLLVYAAYAVLLAIYGVFAWNDKALVPGYIAILTGMIASLGTTHVSNNSAFRGQQLNPPTAPPTAATETVNSTDLSTKQE